MFRLRWCATGCWWQRSRRSDFAGSNTGPASLKPPSVPAWRWLAPSRVMWTRSPSHAFRPPIVYGGRGTGCDTGRRRSSRRARGTCDASVELPARWRASPGWTTPTSAAGCTGSSITRHTWRALFLCRPSRRPRYAAIDGFGDFVSTSLARGEGSRLTMLDRRVLPAFARSVLPCRHPVSGVPEIRRRIQGDGSGAVRGVAAVNQLRQLDSARHGRWLQAGPFLLFDTPRTASK